MGLPVRAMADPADSEYDGPEAEADVIRLPTGGDLMEAKHRRGGIDEAISRAQHHAWVAAGLGTVAFVLANVQVWVLTH